jgi:hypothetical protein
VLYLSGWLGQGALGWALKSLAVDSIPSTS